MSYDAAIKAASDDALKHVRDGSIVGLGSGRAAAILVRTLAELIRDGNISVIGVPTSLQIKAVAQREGIPLAEADHLERIDVVFDGADQIDSQGFVVKGGGGALLRENILFGLAEKVVVVADRTKFVKHLSRSIPVEVHPLARMAVTSSMARMNGRAVLRVIDRGYPFFTENGNIILDCDFGAITDPEQLTHRLLEMPGVLESGIFLRRPDIIYRADPDGRFDIIMP